MIFVVGERNRALWIPEAISATLVALSAALLIRPSLTVIAEQLTFALAIVSLALAVALWGKFRLLDPATIGQLFFFLIVATIGIALLLEAPAIVLFGLTVFGLAWHAGLRATVRIP